MYPNLEELRLDWNPPKYERYVFDPVVDEGCLPPLRRLDLNGLTVGPQFYKQLPASLEFLRISGGSPARIDVGEEYTKLPHLHTLIFNDTPWVTPDTLPLFLVHSQAPIRTLHLNECFNLHEFTTMIVMVDYTRDLKDLSITGLPGAKDDSAQVLYQNLLDLKVLNLSQTQISGCTIRMFADALASQEPGVARLDRLVVKGCSDVSSDAVAYGQAKGLEMIT